MAFSYGAYFSRMKERGGRSKTTGTGIETTVFVTGVVKVAVKVAVKVTVTVYIKPLKQH